MACLARTVSGCTSCHAAARTLQWAQGGIVSPSSRMIRFYASTRLGKSVRQECYKYCLLGLGHGEFAESPVVSTALGFADRFRSSPTSRIAFSGPFTGSHKFSSSSEGGARASDRSKQLGTVDFSKPGSAVDSDASFERRRQKFLEKLACPGCGVYMQDKDPSRPGYFRMPTILGKADDELEEDVELDEDELEELGTNMGEFEGRAELDESDFTLDENEEDDEELMDIDSRLSVATEWNEVGGDRQAGKDAWAEILSSKHRPKKDGAQDPAEEDEEKVVVCARCHALRNYGKVKDESVENLLPDFDFERVVGTRLKKAYGRRAVVLMVVDGSDFDGSFPRKAAEVLAEADEELGSAWQEGKAGNTPRLLVVMNKIDLLPKQISANRLEQWVRRRSKSGGVTRVAGVHLVSAFKGWGVEQLAEHIKQLAGPRGDCWVVGAQNAGKSSLINSLAKFAGEKRKKTALTEAAVPGTTLGVLKLEGILPARARLFDTPGLIHPHQLSTKLNREEQKLVEVRKELKPRTFRVKIGSSVHVGGLFRLDVVEAPSESIYVTVWASAQLPCHMGKSEKAEELFEKHLGDRLKPPADKERAAEIGRWVPRRVTVTGDSWEHSSVDVAVAGLGWVGIGVKGTAILQAWTYEGVAVTTHEAMVYDMAAIFEKPGFTAVKSPPSKGNKKSKDQKPKPKQTKPMEEMVY
ncbi:hypothetical protein KC19_8G200700 [Ceratodon purpureus]|uniref:G domain-containing protein n=1 Tax=Ceratodon purpureus TaxID=3225 RepID=A0A8T0H0E1_CERPU|nr:hypothetical protein KC19_8G200700 [Ceratodon purpureus]